MTTVKIMDDDNRDIAIFIITKMLNTCRAIIIQGDDEKNILPSVFRSMGLVGVILSDKIIQHLVPDYSCHRAEYSIEADFPHILLSTKRRGRHVSFLHVGRSNQVFLGRISTNMNSYSLDTSYSSFG